MTVPSTIALVAALAVLAWIIHLVRRGHLGEHFAAIWIAVGTATVVLAAFPSLLYRATELLHFQLPVNLLFMSALIVQLLVSVHLSVEVGRRQAETRTLAEETAILSLRLKALEARLEERTSQEENVAGSLEAHVDESAPGPRTAR